MTEEPGTAALPWMSPGNAGHLRRLAARIGHQLLDSGIVTTGADAHRRPAGIAVVTACPSGP